MILITRPYEDALKTATKLEEQGYSVLIDPMMTIERKAVPSLVRKPTTIIFTSRHGVWHCPPEILKAQPIVYSVGASTANVAKQVGFHYIRSAAGTVEELFKYIQQSQGNENIECLHICGEDKVGDLSAKLTAKGYPTDELEVYKAVAAEDLSSQSCAGLERGEITSVLFYSPRTADIFLNLILKRQMSTLLKNVTALCLSAEVANKLRLDEWADIKIAQKPTQQHLLALLKK